MYCPEKPTTLTSGHEKPQKVNQYGYFEAYDCEAIEYETNIDKLPFS